MSNTLMMKISRVTSQTPVAWWRQGVLYYGGRGAIIFHQHLSASHLSPSRNTAGEWLWLQPLIYSTDTGCDSEWWLLVLAISLLLHIISNIRCGCSYKFRRWEYTCISSCVSLSTYWRRENKTNDNILKHVPIWFQLSHSSCWLTPRNAPDIDTTCMLEVCVVYTCLCVWICLEILCCQLFFIHYLCIKASLQVNNLNAT